MSTRILYPLLFLISLSAYTAAQHPYYYSIGEEQGFPIKEVYEIVQSTSGHIWIASNNGLYKYDGSRFYHYENPLQSGNALSNLCEDQQGRIWARNFRGQVLYAEDEELKLFINWKDSVKQFPSIRIDKNNNLYISADKKIWRYSIDSAQWKMFANNIQDIYLKYTNIKQGINDRVIAQSPTNTEYIENNRLISIYGELEPDDIYLNNFVFAGKEYIMSALNKVYQVKNDSLLYVADFGALNLEERSIMWIEALSENSLALGTERGILLLNEHFELSAPPVLPNCKVSSICLDKEKNLWVSTLNQGIFVVPDLEMWVYNTFSNPFPEDAIHKIKFTTDSLLYIGFAHGYLGRLSPQGDFTIPYMPYSFFEVSAMNYSTKYKKLLFSQWKNTNLLDGTQKITTEQNTLSAPKAFLLYDENMLVPNAVGLLWISGEPDNDMYTKNGIHRDSILNWESRITPWSGLQNNKIVQLRPDRKALSAILDTVNYRVWGCFTDGLFYFKNNQTTEFKLDNHTVYANDIAQTGNGKLWIATTQQGLICIEDTVLMAQYLPEKTVRTLAADGNDLWLSSTDGLYKLSGDSLTAYNRMDGLASLEISDIQIFDNQIWLATPEGIVRFNKNKDCINRTPPGIEIKQLMIWEQDTVLLPEYTLDYNQNNIAIQLNGLSFRSRGMYQFRYRLLGLSEQWITIPSGNPIVRFPSLPPGEFVFEAVVVNEDGIPSSQSVGIRITIDQPFWQRWWFYTLLVVFAVGVVSVIFIVRIQVFTHRSELQKQLKASEITAIKAQMNPHFIFNALTSIQDLILEKDIRLSNEYLGKFSDLLRKVLEVSGKEQISLSEEIEILNIYLDLEKLRFGGEINFSIEHSMVDENMFSIMIPSMIIQPYVENGIKHGLLHRQGSKKLSIVFYTVDDCLVCVITDNGVGRKRAEEIKIRRNQNYKSFANNATQKRIVLLNELQDNPIKLEILDLYHNGVPEGTEVKLSFPLHRPGKHR